ncbi:uncharacterized protein [Lepidochelys kempii]|uniref:uncharacterized protein isoform X2 n=1 Tax=Lepidochelys kempii TaxID=8472 RepID=UPI003C6FBF8F
MDAAGWIPTALHTAVLEAAAQLTAPHAAGPGVPAPGPAPRGQKGGRGKGAPTRNGLQKGKSRKEQPGTQPGRAHSPRAALGTHSPHAIQGSVLSNSILRPLPPPRLTHPAPRCSPAPQRSQLPAGIPTSSLGRGPRRNLPLRPRRRLDAAGEQAAPHRPGSVPRGRLGPRPCSPAVTADPPPGGGERRSPTVPAPAAAPPVSPRPTDSLCPAGRAVPAWAPGNGGGGGSSGRASSCRGCVPPLFSVELLNCHKTGGVRGIPSGSHILHVYPRNLPSHALQHIVLAGHLDIKDQASSEPKKRKGGWPKGKKRKPPKEFSAPQAPTTGYVIFLNERRIKTKAKHPDLPFTEITKMLAAQWSQLSQAGKQKYIKEAEKDKQRYMKELKAYQDSEAYQAFLERRAVHKVKTLCGTVSLGSRSENEALALSTIDRDESDDLYCRTCNQFFSSFHNKKEHLMGKQHLQNLTGEFEKEMAEFSKHQKLQKEKEEKDESEEEIDSTDVFQFGGLTSQKNFASSDFCFLQEFIFRLLKFKEFELCELKRSLTKAYEDQESLKKQLEDLKNQQLKLEMDFASIKAYSGTLEKEFENLNMIPMLFQFHLQIVDTTTHA